MHQLGITNVVASSGTSLTVEQIRLIRKFTNNVTIIYDGDSAGIKAALRGIGLVLKEGLNVKVILLPEGQDPDDFARRHTLDQVKDYIA
jgi:DNA primase